MYISPLLFCVKGETPFNTIRRPGDVILTSSSFLSRSKEKASPKNKNKTKKEVNNIYITLPRLRTQTHTSCCFVFGSIFLAPGGRVCHCLVCARCASEPLCITSGSTSASNEQQERHMKELLSFARCRLVQMLMPALTPCESRREERARRIDGQRGGKKSRRQGRRQPLLAWLVHARTLA